MLGCWAMVSKLVCWIIYKCNEFNPHEYSTVVILCQLSLVNINMQVRFIFPILSRLILLVNCLLYKITEQCSQNWKLLFFMFPFNFFHSNEYPARINFSDHILILERHSWPYINFRKTLWSYINFRKTESFLLLLSTRNLQQLRAININILVPNVPLVEYILRLMSGD